MFDRQQEVNPAGALVYRYLSQGHPADRLIDVAALWLVQLIAGPGKVTVVSNAPTCVPP